ncbi:DUF4328 domain-containing protein [Nocardia sp. NPDC004068]|uniref:DUF4328 domain-containing protein n=1 Tax=Nocardia sp. NPDC004068 TaxID=3364303 RepID=UPI0036A26F87
MSAGSNVGVVRGGGRIRPLRAQGISVMVLIAGGIVMQCVGAILDWTTLADLERSWEQLDQSDKQWRSNGWVYYIGLALLVAAGIVFLMWLWRARRNAESLSAARHRLSIGWVIGAWFCPVVNFWFPYLIVADVVRASAPRPSDEQSRPRLVIAWWLSVLVCSVLSVVTLIMSLPTIRTQTTGGYLVLGTAPVGGFGLIVAELIRVAGLTVAAILLGAIIFRVQRWQDIRATQHFGDDNDKLSYFPAAARQSSAMVGSSAASQPLPGTTAAPATLPMRATDPAVVGPYTLIGRLGSDANAEVYLGRGDDGAMVVVRIVRPEPTTGGRDELARVFASARAVRSPFVAAVLGADAEAEPPWIATEYLAGRSLHDLVDEHGPLPPAMVADIAFGIAHALSAIHDAGLTHGGVTPKSVTMTETGPRTAAFGALPAHPELSAFSSPEQLAAEPVTPASDVFSLGGVLAYALTGRPPFGDSDPATRLHRIRTQPPDLIGIPESRLGFIITGCLDLRPGARLTTTQILGQLEAARPQQPTPALPQPAYATSSDAPRGRHVRAVTIGVSLAVVVIIAVGVLVGSLVETDRSTASDTHTSAQSTAGQLGPWGKVQWIADVFPYLLPTTPAAQNGYRGIGGCDANPSGYLTCHNTTDPRRPDFTITCSHTEEFTDQRLKLVGKQQRGKETLLFWDRHLKDGDTGLIISFEDSPRSRCRIESRFLTGSQADDIDWWRSASL